MTFFGALYKLFIGPLELFFEVVFVLADRLIGNLGLSIIVLSLIMNFLVLPLYRRADAMQEEQRETENKLKKWVTHIKKTFKGDERFMMLQTYYRQNNYKPTSILKGSVSLLLEIPFFIAAYNFLSHAGVFDGFSFGPFVDMGKPDGLIKIAGFSINLLPILMTAINIVSSAIYTKGLPTSSKVQLYGMAGIFLVLLYNSPAALVFYWTLNNLFSLVKNLCYKLKNPRFILGIVASIIGIIVFLFTLIAHPFDTFKKQLFVIGISVLLQLPICLYFLKKHMKESKTVQLRKSDKAIFYFSVIFLAVLTGLLIPSAVINSSPEEFVNTVTFTNPLTYVLSSSLIAVGTFVIWFSIFYMLMDNRSKKVMGLVVAISAIAAIVNYMFFGMKKVNISSLLVMPDIWNKKDSIINIFVIILVAFVVIFIFKKKEEILKYFFLLSSVVLVFMSGYNCIHTNIILSERTENMKEKNNSDINIPLSTTGKNVMVIMVDRAVSSYLPYIFNEKPEVAKKFDGFTYYPNTISFGGHTNFGAPPLFGGYEYTPKEMNKRDTEPLAKKHDESLKVMPVIFDQNGYEVTVSDPPFAGYGWVPALSIYDDYPRIHKFKTEGNIGLSQEDKERNEKNKDAKLYRDFFCYSLTKVAPLAIQETLHNMGKYNSIKPGVGHTCYTVSTSYGIDQAFLEYYNILKQFPDITTIDDEERNTFFMINNHTAHEAHLLKEPEYVPLEVVNNTEYDKAHADRFTVNGRTIKMERNEQMQFYHANMAAIMLLGDYFDYLRENNAYNNTRIIIIADHGNNNNQFDDLILGPNSDDDVMFYNPLFLVKDFNSTGDVITDNQFMTNADVPTLALKGLVENPINPFTNKPINSDAKIGQKQYILHSRKMNIGENNGNKFLPDPWYSVHDNIFDLNNWELLPVE